MKKVKSTNRLLMLLMLTLWTLAPFGVQQTYAQKARNENVTLDLNNVTIDQLLTQIKRQTGYSFIISSDLARTLPRVNVQAKDKPVKAVLDEVLDKVNCTYDIDGRTITIYRKLTGNRERTIRAMCCQECPSV